jgi:hypothetical protein
MGEYMEDEINKLAEMFPDSVEISKGQKGGYGWTIKLRFPTGVTNEDKVKQLTDLDNKLREKFPELKA